MHPQNKQNFEKIYRACRSVLGLDTWNRFLGVCVAEPGAENFPDTLALHMNNLGLPNFLPELARLEWNLHQMVSGQNEIPPAIGRICVNPTVRLLQLSWKNLPAVLNPRRAAPPVAPEPGEELVLAWQNPQTGGVKVRAANGEDLLALKIVAEDVRTEEVALEGKVPVGAVDAAVDRAIEKGILLAPPPGIRRDPSSFPIGKAAGDDFLSSSVFTLQWHVTQACDLHCRHCYDRSERTPLKLEQGVALLDDLRAFCRSRHVKGQVSFTGGNPLLYPHFGELYRAAAERGLSTAVLGNPAPRERIEELIGTQRPGFFQVSLEGLPDYNDTIRGSGHFERVIAFLKVLRDLQVYSMVMLTLTKDNIDQVLPLAEVLRDRTDSFTFNRLSRVGEGARLQLPAPETYAAFLEAYLGAAESNPILALKDNLINVLNYRKGRELFGGCTGFGCGAAFNFLAVLPDGETHACRKFPSLIGNVFEKTLTEIYDSDTAHRYRLGSKGCSTCSLHRICRGCPAVVHGLGHDVFQDRDPFCFL